MAPFVATYAGPNLRVADRARLGWPWHYLRGWLLAVVVVVPALLVADRFGLVWMIIGEVIVLSSARLVYEAWRRRGAPGC